MCKVTISDENGFMKTCLVSNESPIQILKYFKYNPETKIVYLNGKILSRDKMMMPIPETKETVHLAIKAKTVQ